MTNDLIAGPFTGPFTGTRGATAPAGPVTVTLYHRETGAPLVVAPVDAREILSAPDPLYTDVAPEPTGGAVDDAADDDAADDAAGATLDPPAAEARRRRR